MRELKQETQGQRREDAGSVDQCRPVHHELLPHCHPLHTLSCGTERRIGSEETGGTVSVKNDPLCIKSVFHGLREIQYIKG